VGLDRQEVEDLRVKLDKVVSKRFKLKRTPTSSDEPRFSKRPKVQAEEERTSVEPRQDSELVSSHPRVIHLVPKPPKSIPYVFVVLSLSCSKRFTQVIVFGFEEPPCKDTEQELKERIYRSALSAADLDQINDLFPMVRIPWIESRILTHIPCFPGERPEVTASTRKVFAVTKNHLSAFTPRGSSGCPPSSAHG